MQVGTGSRQSRGCSVSSISSDESAENYDTAATSLHEDDDGVVPSDADLKWRRGSA